MTYKYYCKKCEYGSENKYNYSTHLNTSKHITLAKRIGVSDLNLPIKDTLDQKIGVITTRNGDIYQKNGAKKNISSGLTKKEHKLNRKKPSNTITYELAEEEHKLNRKKPSNTDTDELAEEEHKLNRKKPSNTDTDELTEEEHKLNTKKSSSTVICEYCNKRISYVNHKARHYRNCRERKKIDHAQLLQRIELADKKAEDANQKAEDAIKFDNKLLIQRLKLEKEQAEQKAEEAIKSKQELEKSKYELEKDYREHVKITTELLKNCSNTTINNNIDKRHMNIYYVINKYTDAYDYDDIISKKLTRAEKDHIKMFGPSAGCESIIMNRCVNGIPKNKRPIHCIDASREKFVYRTEGEWAIDLNGDKIMGPAMAQVRTQFDISDKNTNLDDRVNSQRLLLDMDMNARKRTVKNLKKATLLKN